MFEVDDLIEQHRQMEEMMKHHPFPDTEAFVPEEWLQERGL